MVFESKTHVAASMLACIILVFVALGQTRVSGMTDRDTHSFARPEEARVTHVHLDLTVDFATKTLRGAVTHTFARKAGSKDPLRLDVKALDILGVEATSGREFRQTTWRIEKGDPILGDGLIVDLEDGDNRVRVAYRTTSAGTGLQWLSASQTLGGRQPFLFSQSQAIHARTWIPCQDSPGVRVTYSAVVKTPDDLVAVMSAEMKTPKGIGGVFLFDMPQPIPSYLIALAVGDLAFESMGPRSGVWSEPGLLEASAWEFADTEKMMSAVEALYGPYRWGRYDILVLPPSFPFGGMENPRLTFATPTILAGDRSLTSLVAHELAHSWSGNLVTNSNWRDFWLNEGFTVYLEHRIVEAIYGKPRAEMEIMLALRDLGEEMGEMAERDQILHVNLDGRDPDDGFTGVPYDKGAAFLRRLEECFGREAFDAFLRKYFDHHAFKSITTADFRSYLDRELLSRHPDAAKKVDIDLWIEGPGLPADCPTPSSDAFEKVGVIVADWKAGRTPTGSIDGSSWTTHEWLHFIGALGGSLSPDRMSELDAALKLTASENSEITCAWLELAISSRYEAAWPKLERFLTRQGRRKFLKPLYKALASDPELKKIGSRIYEKARPLYHAISVQTIDEILGVVQ